MCNVHSHIKDKNNFPVMISQKRLYVFRSLQVKSIERDSNPSVMYSMTMGQKKKNAFYPSSIWTDETWKILSSSNTNLQIIFLYHLQLDFFRI